MQHPTGSRENRPPRQRMTSLYIFNCQNALSCVSEEQLKAVITALKLLLQHFVLRLHVENLKQDLTKTSAFTIQIQVMTGASDQYSDEGDFPTSPLHVQPAGKRQAIRSDIFGIHRKFCRASGGACASLDITQPLCVRVVAFPLPADPTQPGGAAGEETLWKPVDVNITSCPLYSHVVVTKWSFSLFILARMVIWLSCLLISAKKNH